MGGVATCMALMTAAIFMRFGRAPTTQSMGAAVTRDGIDLPLPGWPADLQAQIPAAVRRLPLLVPDCDVYRSTSESQRC